MTNKEALTIVGSILLAFIILFARSGVSRKKIYSTVDCNIVPLF